MKSTLAMVISLALATAARAQFDTDALKKAAEEKARTEAKSAGTGQLEKQINDKLLEEARKNQCAFKSGSDKFEGKCDDKVDRLHSALMDAKKALKDAGVSGFKFEVSGHTDSSGNAKKNKELSQKRAAKMVKELVKKGIPKDEIIAVGGGSEAPLERPDDTREKKAGNRRYELRVRLLAK